MRYLTLGSIDIRRFLYARTADTVVSGGTRLGMTKTVFMPPARIVGVTAAMVGPSRRCTWKSAGAGRVVLLKRVKLAIVGGSGVMCCNWCSLQRFRVNKASPLFGRLCGLRGSEERMVVVKA